MNHRIATLAALAIIGSSAFGLETLAVSRVARGATDWLGSPEALAFGRAGRIAAESLGRTAADHARDFALDATLEVVRGLSAVYAATGGKARVISAIAPEVHVIRILKSNAATTEFDLESEVDAEKPCCQDEEAERTTS